jgi:hypothetical protein
MRELSEEEIQRAIKSFGVSREEIEARWAAINAGGEEFALQQLGEALGQAEQELDELIDSARIYMDAAKGDHVTGVVNFYLDSHKAIDPDQGIDAERTIQYLAIAAYRLAEAREEIKQLNNAVSFEGNRRAGPLA